MTIKRGDIYWIDLGEYEDEENEKGGVKKIHLLLVTNKQVQGPV